MTKKHIRLYAALFLVSMLISATLIVAHADSQQSTTITYTSLSPDEKTVIQSIFQLISRLMKMVVL